MAAHLDTVVDGEPSSCAAAAEWMGTLADAARSAADRFGTAVATARSGWHGPASESFHTAVHYVPDDLGQVAETGAKISTGLAEFGFTLTAVIGKMTDLRGRASAVDWKWTAPSSWHRHRARSWTATWPSSRARATGDSC